MPNDHKIRAAWERYYGPCDDEGYIPDPTPAYCRGYRDGYAEAALDRLNKGRAPEAIETMKKQITLLRIELGDALMMAYGAPMNWPESARELLKGDG